MAFTGSYMGPWVFAERERCPHYEFCYARVTTYIARDSKCATQLVAKLQEVTLKQLNLEPHFLRCTIVRESDSVHPGPKDDCVVIVAQIWRC